MIELDFTTVLKDYRNKPIEIPDLEKKNLIPVRDRTGAIIQYIADMKELRIEDIIYEAIFYEKQGQDGRLELVTGKEKVKRNVLAEKIYAKPHSVKFSDFNSIKYIYEKIKEMTSTLVFAAFRKYLIEQFPEEVDQKLIGIISDNPEDEY